MEQPTSIATWYSSDKVATGHINLPVRQVYVWIISENSQVAIVTKNDGKSQLPGGHPEVNENNLITAQREVNEETGLDISSYIFNLKLFGYRLIEESGDKYLQLRYILLLPQASANFKLLVNEKSDEERPVKLARWVDLLKLSEFIPWVTNSEEYNSVVNMVLKK